MDGGHDYSYRVIRPTTTALTTPTAPTTRAARTRTTLYAIAGVALLLALALILFWPYFAPAASQGAAGAAVSGAPVSAPSAAPALRAFTLTAKEVDWEIMPGSQWLTARFVIGQRP